MKIASVDAYDLRVPYGCEFRPAWQRGLVRTERDFTLVIVRTDNGLVGYAGRDGHHSSVVRGAVTPYLLGQPVASTERHAKVFRNAGGMWFIDMALWDILGKSAGLPLHQLWGSARDSVPAYASTAQLGSVDDRVELARRYRSEGFNALKLRLRRDDLAADLEVVDAVVAAVPAMTIMVDGNQATDLPELDPPRPWDYYRAHKMAKELEERGILWLEEPLARHHRADLRRLTEATTLYIAGGEANQGLHEFRLLVEEHCYDIIQPDCTLSEGISQLRKIASLAEIYGRQFVPHHGASGLGLAATLHLACSIPGETWLEMMYEPPVRAIENYQQLGGIVTSRIWIDDDGNVKPSSTPGLGVEVDETRVAQYVVG